MIPDILKFWISSIFLERMKKYYWHRTNSRPVSIFTCALYCHNINTWNNVVIHGTWQELALNQYLIRAEANNVLLFMRYWMRFFLTKKEFNNSRIIYYNTYIYKIYYNIYWSPMAMHIPVAISRICFQNG